MSIATMTLRFVARSRGLAKFTAGCFYLMALIDWLLAIAFAVLGEWGRAWDGLTNGAAVFFTAAMLSTLIHVTEPKGTLA